MIPCLEGCRQANERFQGSILETQILRGTRQLHFESCTYLHHSEPAASQAALWLPAKAWLVTFLVAKVWKSGPSGFNATMPSQYLGENWGGGYFHRTILTCTKLLPKAKQLAQLFRNKFRAVRLSLKFHEVMLALFSVLFSSALSL